ncbi:hypothetical protein EAF56_24470 [Vibrio alginolyticus]|uniref:Uncharacterized protein n=1 Tax=Vibrio alginolyticus TaxID=663 RepID=A0AA36XT71_VIBAL|nr:hypothetical protein AL545_15305 [Vibrio alginolyticus]EGQ9138058.1 hypothetical protein [Vibrio alginolyticus]EGR1299123.1 hypothetical protein [Vibrio alginolyticus]PNP27115.1 hypothetical protein AL553_011920 [Vibrio alginolyticus]
MPKSDFHIYLFPLAPNAALSGEQRRPPHLKYCTVNTKFKVNQKCRALGIRPKCFVSNMA